MTHIFSQRRALLFKKKDLQSANIAICRGNLAIFLSSGKFGTLPFFNLRWEFVKDDSKGNSTLFLFPNSAPFASSISALFPSSNSIHSFLRIQHSPLRIQHSSLQSQRSSLCQEALSKQSNNLNNLSANEQSNLTKAPIDSERTTF